MYFAMNFSFTLRARTQLRACALVFLSVVLTGSAASAQRRQQLETRAGLIEQAAREEQAGRRGQAALIRARLQDGDYQEGDRVVILLENLPGAGRGDVAANRPDTLTVRMGRVLQFPQAKYQGIKDLEIGGILRSELPEKLTSHFALVYNNPILRVTSLVQISVTGAVLRGGFIDIPPDERMTSIFTFAGGLASDADMRKIVIIRGARELMSAKEVQTALDNSMTIDGAHLRAGDQINVPRKTSSNWMAYLGLGLSILTLAIGLSRRD
jgi:hypothetical protein